MKKRLFTLILIGLLLVIFSDSSCQASSNIGIISKGSNNLKLGYFTRNFSLNFPGWGTNDYTGGTHKFITEKALNIFYKDKGSKAYATFNKSVGGQTASQWVVRYSYFIDKYDIEVRKVIYEHYYGPEGTVAYKNKVTSSPSNLNAKSRLYNAYNKSVSDYKSGRYIDSYNSLGEAIHFVADLNAPHHTKPISREMAGSHHALYEDKVNIWIATFPSDFTEKTASDLYSHITSSNLYSIPDNLDMNRSNVYKNCNIMGIQKNSLGYYDTVDLIKKSERASAALIYRFLVDTGQV